MLRAFDVPSSMLASGLRLGAGSVACHAGPRPAEMLQLYEFEGCPYCRKVREALTMLDLSVLVYPCPKGGPTYRPRVIERGGKARFPYLADPNAGAAMYESADIIDHLYAHYGRVRAPWWLRSDATMMLGSLATAVRLARGIRYRQAKQAEQPLELYSFEASPHCRLVRETLSELELAYVLHNAARGSARRAELRERSGRTTVPWLFDPNTGFASSEPAEIGRYLRRQYAAAPRA